MTTTPLFLICHKVRGERAYDVAIQMPCPCCDSLREDPECNECDALGYWWIIPTSGHRAHPVLTYDLADIVPHFDQSVPDLAAVEDHYQVAFAPRGAAVDARPEFLRALLRKPQVVINRRGL